jgi:hypothetical protein
MSYLNCKAGAYKKGRTEPNRLEKLAALKGAKTCYSI